MTLKFTRYSFSQNIFSHVLQEPFTDSYCSLQLRVQSLIDSVGVRVIGQLKTYVLELSQQSE